MTDLYNKYDALTFKIQGKKSASPTIMFIHKNKDNPFIMKVWLASDKTPEAEGLRYENRIYKSKVLPLLEIDNKLPLLNYSGSTDDKEATAEQIGSHLGISIDDKFGWQLFLSSIYIFSKDTRQQCDYSVTTINNFITSNPEIDQAEVRQIKLEAIILPFVKFKSFSDEITICSTERLIKYIKEIIFGIRSMYSNNLIHNDLHTGNIMIEKNTDNILIFDWDRGYVNGYDNPFLDNKRCKTSDRDTCGMSQCNIKTGGGYATDLYKILSYILHARRNIDAHAILQKVFNINNYTNPNTGVTMNARQSVIDKLTQHPFFSNYNCTYLQYPDEDMLIVHKLFGNIDEIHHNANNNSLSFAFKKMIKKYPDIYNDKKMKLKESDMTNNQSNMTINNQSSDIEINKLINDRKKRLKLEYGNIIKEKLPTWEGVKDKHSKSAKYLSEIIEDNNIRKFGIGKKYYM